MANAAPRSLEREGSSKAENSGPAVSNSRRQGNASGRVLVTLGRGVYLLGSFLLIVALAYLIGRVLLVEPVGNEAPLHLSYISWISEYFPDLPDWYPLHGTGVSIRRAYPMFSHVIVAFVHQLSGLSVLQSFHLVGFLAVVTGTFGIYFFGWRALRSQTVGLIAASFYLLTPITWFYIREHGYIATVVGTAGIPWTLLCFDRYFSCLARQDHGAGRQFWFVALVLAFAFTTLGHFFAGAAAGLGLILYAGFRSLVAGRGKRRQALKAGITGVSLGGIGLGLLLAFWLVPIVLYSAIGARHGSNVTPNALTNLSLAELFSLTSPDTPITYAVNASFPVVIAGLGLGSSLVAGLCSRKALAFSLVGVTVVAAAQFMGIRSELVKLSSMFNYLASERTLLLLLTIQMPVAAAYGTWALARILVDPAGLVQRLRLSPRGNRSPLHSTVVGLLSGGLALAIAGGALYLFRNVSSKGPEYVNYGPQRGGIDIHDLWSLRVDGGSVGEQLAISNWPPFELSDTDPAIEAAAAVAAYLPRKDNLRYDISPYLGRLAENLAWYSSGSQVGAYFWPANLNLSMWGYQGNAFFSREAEDVEYGTPRVIDELAKWFGIEYVFLEPDLDRTDIYEAAGWDRTVVDSYGSVPYELWHFSQAPALATLSTRPTVLVISRPDFPAYDQAFRSATRGAIPYDEAWIFQGEHPVDSYSLEELQRFNALFLTGYGYKNSLKAWSLLEEYVRLGGSLYVDTGWQWTVPEWEFAEAPAVLPVSRLSWRNYGVTNEYTLEDREVGGDVDLGKFSALEWEGQPWGVSGASEEDVREWGQVVLSVHGQPLVVAGDYGQGRVVWSGMTLVAHALDKDNQEEMRLLRNLVAWLIRERPGDEYPVVVSRDHPDLVRFSMDMPAGERAWLYWREADYPAWHGYVSGTKASRREVPVYRWGPGFMAMPIEDVAGSVSVELAWRTPFVERLAVFVSLATTMTLAALVVDSLFLGGRSLCALQARLRRISEVKQVQGSVEWLPASSVAEDTASYREGSAALGQYSASEGAVASDPGGALPFTVGEDVAEDGEVEVIWRQLQVSKREASLEDRDAEHMIAWWRRNREGGGNG